jgi:hypothetical protein
VNDPAQRLAIKINYNLRTGLGPDVWCSIGEAADSQADWLQGKINLQIAAQDRP